MKLFSASVGSVAVLLLLFPALTAEAEDDTAARTGAAARAFRDGQKAQLLGKYREAAEKYELADELLPTPEALRSALRARLAAEDFPVAAAHAQLLKTRCTEDQCMALADSVLEKLRPELTHVTLSCSAPCTVNVDGRPFITREAQQHQFYVRPGVTTVAALFSVGTRTVTIEGLAGAGLAVSAEPPVIAAPPMAVEEATDLAQVEIVQPAPPPLPRRNTTPITTQPPLHGGAPQDEGLAPTVSLIGFGVAAALGAATLWSVSDTQSAHELYLAAPSTGAWDDGRSRDLRSNVLLYSAVTTAAVSALLAVVWTDW